MIQMKTLTHSKKIERSKKEALGAYLHLPNPMQYIKYVFFSLMITIVTFLVVYFIELIYANWIDLIL